MQQPVNARSDTAVVTVNEPPQKRVSWGAIFAGVVVALAIYILLSLLGLGIGLSTVNPTTEDNAVSASLGIGAGIWSVVSLIVALFAGGWVAGRLSGVARSTAGLLHGLVVWGLSTVFLMYLLTTTVGTILGGAMSILQSAASVAGQGIAAAAQPVADRIQQGDVDWSSLREEAMQILRQTGEPELQPENLRQEAREATTQARTELREADRQQAEQELGAALDRLFNRVDRIASEADKEAVANVLAARTGMTRQEAMQRVDEWESTYQGLREAAGGQMSDLRQGAERAAESVAGGVASAAIWTFFALLLAAIAAALGGRAGAPEMIEVVKT